MFLYLTRWKLPVYVTRIRVLLCRGCRLDRIVNLVDCNTHLEQEGVATFHGKLWRCVQVVQLGLRRG